MRISSHGFAAVGGFRLSSLLPVPSKTLVLLGKGSGLRQLAAFGSARSSQPLRKHSICLETARNQLLRSHWGSKKARNLLPGNHWVLKKFRNHLSGNHWDSERLEICFGSQRVHQDALESPIDLIPRSSIFKISNRKQNAKKKNTKTQRTNESRFHFPRSK